MTDAILDGTVEGEPAAAPEGDEVNNGESLPEIPEFLKDMDLPDDIKTSRVLQDHKGLSDIVKSYVHASKMVGADKIVIPGEKATDEEWADTYKKLGLPDADKYDLHRLQDSGVDEKFFDGFKVKAHEAGILPRQASKLLTFFEEQAKIANDTGDEQAELQVKKELEELQTEWGGAFKGNVNRANFALQKFGGDELVNFLSENSLSSNPTMIKFLSKVGEAMGEDNILGESTTQNTPSQAITRMNSIKGDKTHPYWTGDPSAKLEMEELAKQAYGSE